MNVKVLGFGCAKCKALALVTEQAVEQLAFKCAVEKVTDLQEMARLGVMTTPALVVNGVVKVAGKIPTISELKRILQETS